MRADENFLFYVLYQFSIQLCQCVFVLRQGSARTVFALSVYPPPFALSLSKGERPSGNGLFQKRNGIMHMWNFIIFLVLTAMLWAPPSNAAVDHRLWTALLARYVDDDGRVAYHDLQVNDRPAFEQYLTMLAPAQIAGMSEAEEKAFWINAYNALIVNGVLQGYTAESILGRKRFFSWYSLLIAGEERSPDDIEHKILRKKFHDARIHFALVCASTSCPQLRREAYVAERLDQQLDDATRAFINDPTRNRIDSQQVALSQIFQWFTVDFVSSAGSVPAFVQRFVEDDKRAILQAKSSNLQYLDYDWTLNAQTGQRVS